MQGRKLIQLLERGEHLIVYKHRRHKAVATMHHAVPYRLHLKILAPRQHLS
jgi:hypothetical protein